MGQISGKDFCGGYFTQREQLFHDGGKKIQWEYPGSSTKFSQKARK